MSYGEADTLYLAQRKPWPARDEVSIDFVEWESSLRIDRSTPIATMGSCFALNVASWLNRHDYNILDVNGIDGSGPWGKVYTPGNFWQFMAGAAGLWEPTLSPWTGKDGTSVDPYRKWVPISKKYPYDALLSDTRLILEKAEVFILTLGLTEAWKEDGDFIYQAPPQHILSPDRHQFVPMDHATAHQFIEAGILLARRVNPDLQFLLTVSPIPLRATFRSDCDAYTANLDSKQSLRIAARQLAGSEGLENVHYFPSYEMATIHPRAFRPDGRHLTPEYIDSIMLRFVDRYSAT